MASATCPVCWCLFSITSCGVLRVHGPLSNRCAGSSQFPLPVTSAATVSQPSSSHVETSTRASTMAVIPPIDTVFSASLSSSPSLTTSNYLSPEPNGQSECDSRVATPSLPMCTHTVTEEDSFNAFLDMLDEAIPDDRLTRLTLMIWSCRMPCVSQAVSCYNWWFSSHTWSSG